MHLDHHFAPQVINLYLTGLAPHFIGRLERMEDVQEFLSAYNICLENHIRHAKNASRDVPALSERQIKLIQDIYWDDFALLGYDLDATSLFVPPTIKQKQWVRQSFAKSHDQKFEKILSLNKRRLLLHEQNRPLT